MQRGQMFERWGGRIRDHRGSRSQGWLAHIMGVNQSTISAWERGVYPPSDSDKLKLSEAFDVALEALFPWSDLRRPKQVQRVETPKAES